ncbi:glycosyltransferase family 2 protein [Cobetia sp. L2A1]|uniref:glycosyltransferase family 2 protein n=1 Tax=Cobetia sp. L2A1 TaxID=2686360 RepID=UPI00131CA7EA|nr:glycosyltransferase family 2 protein [Cobetia sp. L2A1]
MSNIKFTLATCIRNEGPYILEWYLYYKELGVDNFVVYSNDNTDGSDKLLSLMHSMKLIDWRPRTLAEGESPQITAYQDLSQELFDNPESENHYLAWLDMDEFLVLHKHDSLHELIKEFKYPDGLVLSWKHFGSSGINCYSDAPTIDKFILSSSSNNQNKLFKTISRVDRSLYKSINNHHPIPHKGSNPNIIYATAKMVTFPDHYLNGGNPVRDDDALFYYDVCQLNHYAIRSKQEFEWKRRRGNGRLALNADRKHFLDGYFYKHDSNEEVDYTAKEKYSQKLKEAFNSLPYELLSVHNSIIEILKYTYGKDSGDVIDQEKIKIKFHRAKGISFTSKFSLDTNKISLTPGREVSVGGVFVLDSEDVKIEGVRICNDDILKHGVIDLPSPGMRNQYRSKFNSSSARFSFQFCSHLDLSDTKLFIDLSNGDEVFCGEFKVIQNSQPVLKSFSHELEFFKLAGFIKKIASDKPVLYIANKGNFGDALIRQGAIAFFNKHHIEYKELKKDYIFSDDFDYSKYKDYLCIYGGSGAWCAVTPGAKDIVNNLASLFTEVIVLPSTYEISGKWSNVHLWSRGNKESFYKSSGHFCHDMAFSLPRLSCTGGSGDGFFYRNDKEASGKMIHPLSNRDISFEGNSYSEISPFFDAIAKYENIYTDRLHVAIAACLLDKEVFLSSSSYFKIREIYQSSLFGFFKNINFVEV